MAVAWVCSLPGRAWLIRLLATGALLAAGVAVGAEPAWTLSCKPAPDAGKLACVLSQVLTVAETNARLLTVEIIPAEAVGNTDAAIRLSLPHGVKLNSVVGVRVDDGKLFKLPLQSSDSAGLYTTQALGSDMIEAMKKGDALVVSLALTDGRLLDVPASLVGFSMVYDAAQRVAAPAPPSPSP